MLRSVMRTLGQSLLVAVLLAVGMGTLAAQTDVEASQLVARYPPGTGSHGVEVLAMQY